MTGDKFTMVTPIYLSRRWWQFWRPRFLKVGEETRQFVVTSVLSGQPPWFTATPEIDA